MKLFSKTILKALFLCSLVAVAHGREDDDNTHYEDPDEIDVEFIPLCKTNEEGFGIVGTSSYRMVGSSSATTRCCCWFETSAFSLGVLESETRLPEKG